jgi:hypothetical protein
MSPQVGHGAVSGAGPGKRALTDGMSRRHRYLRELITPLPNVPDEIAITTTMEYLAFVDPGLVWRWGLKVTPEEALLAAKLILEAMRAGDAVDWQLEAVSFLGQARARLGLPEAPEHPRPAHHPDGGGEACETELVAAEPLVCEPSETTEVSRTDTDGTAAETTHHDPGLPGLAEMVDEAEEMARDLEAQGEQEDSFARQLLDLVTENRKLIISVGILVGSYVVATKFVGGRLVFTWASHATGVQFERHLARSLRPTAELEHSLRTLEELTSKVRRVGSGLNWKVHRERWEVNACAQIDDDACGPAAMEMVLRDRGLPHPPQSMIARMARGGVDAVVPTDALQAQEILAKIDPAGGWQSNVLRNPDSETWKKLAGAMSETGTWIADVRESFAEGSVGHAVVVDAVSRDGVVSVRDPWPFIGGERGMTGTAYEVAWEEFFARWSGIYTYSSQGKR